MLWIGIILTVLDTLAYFFKLYVVWDVSRDVFNGGGMPTMDLPIFYPILISVGLAAILRAIEATPFPYFGLVLSQPLELAGFGGQSPLADTRGSDFAFGYLP